MEYLKKYFSKKNIKFVFFFFFIFSIYLSDAQGAKETESNGTIDSLLSVLKNLPSPAIDIKLKNGSDTAYINTLSLLSQKYLSNNNYEKALHYIQQALFQAEKYNYQRGKGLAYNISGDIYWYKGDYALSYTNYFKALKIFEKLNDKIKIIDCNRNIAWIYLNQKNYEKAIESFTTSLSLNMELNRKKAISVNYSDIGIAYTYLGDYEKSIENHLNSLEIAEEMGNKKGMLSSYNNIGLNYEEQGNLEKALDFFFKSLTISLEIGSKLQIAVSYYNIGNNYLEKSKLEESYNYLIQSLIIYKEIGYKNGINNAYLSLSMLYEKKGNYKQAFEYHQLYSDIKDTILNEESSKQIAEMNTKYESEKKEKDIELLTKDKSLQQAEISKQKLIRNGFIGGLVLTLLLGFVLLNRFQVTRKQKKIIESQNFQIVESINYSKKIQNSLLPSIENMQKVIPHLFVFNEPKDIVSGDFYYFKEFEKHTLLACVDCTGHGVPGGFMSTLSSLLLDKIVNSELLSPSQILSKLSDEIIRVLHQQDGGEIQDGMDLSICLIDRTNKKIEFSGARNGIIVVTNEQAKRYKADPLPVGGNYMKKGVAIERNFSTQSISINSTDWIYMYTDGFMEQVGGSEGIPMNYTQFENQLINVSKKQNPYEKNKSLQMEIDRWRGKHERDDDILIMGFQLI
jgi:serine phosphatase RsbU (regulator of sigma subunit)